MVSGWGSSRWSRFCPRSARMVSRCMQMYEQDPQRLPTARSTISTDPAVRVWTAAKRDLLAVQALALMDHAGVQLPPGRMEELVSIRIPAAKLSGVDTEFHPWSNAKMQAMLLRGGPRNLRSEEHTAGLQSPC